MESLTYILVYYVLCYNMLCCSPFTNKQHTHPLLIKKLVNLELEVIKSYGVKKWET